ncbi:hypothetical protein DL98DRAFT_6199 [Cadophora sp. DSE1049]|nr:hypothetical protein DL98DRAFT_6199 [Cadophora sp. DSE1049]
MSSTKIYKITPAPISYIPTLAHISDLAFKTDTHTQLKELCRPKPKIISPNQSSATTSSHASSMASALKSWMSLPKGKIVVLQAVEEGSGEIVGWAAWAGKGVEVVWEGEDMNETQEDVGESLAKETEGEGEENAEEPKPSPQILALETLTNNTMTFWATHFSTPSPSLTSPSRPPPHLILISLTIHPLHQGHGLGTSLINWGTRLADTHGVFCWVSSSDGGYRVFEKAGFREVGRLGVDLDEFAVGADGWRVRKPDADGEGVGRWGMYTWRWMKRDAVVR